MSGKKDLPYDLENMSVPELEVLLQQDFIASNGSAPDVDYITAILEVIQKKEQALPNYQPMDAEKAWEEFQSFYNTEEGRANSIYRSDEDEKFVLKAAESVPKQKKFKTLHKRLVVAALIAALLAITMIPVLGYANVLQMVIAYWTDDYFSFVTGNGSLEKTNDSTPLIIPEGFEDLWTYMEENQIQNLMVPQYIPDGFQASDIDFYVFPLSNSFEFHVLYTKGNEYISINIIKKDLESRSFVEKDKNIVDICEFNNFTYYIFSNNGEYISTIYYEGIEYSFGTTLQEFELKQIIDSMCKG